MAVERAHDLGNRMSRTIDRDIDRARPLQDIQIGKVLSDLTNGDFRAAKRHREQRQATTRINTQMPLILLSA